MKKIYNKKQSVKKSSGFINSCMKKSCAGLAVCCAMLMLSGCSDPMPELSEEENAMIVEYAAGALLKYNKNYTGKIVSDEIIEQQLAKEKEFAENTEKARLARIRDEETKQQEKQSGTAGSDSSMTAEELGHFLGTDPAVLTYEGYQICKDYPDADNMEEVLAVMTARPGNQFCVLKFTFTNPGESETAINILDKRYRFLAVINDSQTVQVQATYALEDLSTYEGSIPAGESEEAVLILELTEEAAANIQTITLLVSGNGSNAKVLLQ